MKYLIDTNVFLRFLIPDSANASVQRECIDFFSAIEKGEIVTITLSTVYAELVWVLQSFYRFDRESVAEDLETFVAHGIEAVDSVDISRAVMLYRNSGKKFIDCLIASHKDLYAGTAMVVSYDRDFDVLGVRRIEPSAVRKNNVPH